MNPITHFLTGWAVANSSAALDVKERALITIAGIIPDIDGLGAIPELLTKNSQHPLAWFTLYHHQLHNLAFGVLVAAVCFALASHRWTTGLLALFSFHLHLFEDLLGARGPDGYQWPIPYLAPFSHRLQLTWNGQWGLNAWPNFAITGCLLTATFYLALEKRILSAGDGVGPRGSSVRHCLDAAISAEPLGLVKSIAVANLGR